MPNKKLPVYDICSLSGRSASSTDFMIDRFGHYLDNHKDLYFPHKHSFYHLVYFTKGSGKHAIDFVDFPVAAGQIYFMSPGQVHTWNFKNSTDGFIINFSERYINELIANPRYLDQFNFFSGTATEQVINIPVTGQKYICRLFENILLESISTKELSNDMIITSLIQLFITVDRYSLKHDRPKANSYNFLMLKNFQKLIEMHYKEKKLTKDYAAMLYITPNHLNALTKDITGHSAGELVRERILLEAKRMLTNAEVSIAAIAADLEFTDNSYFSRFFKKYAGVTPEIFRKQNT